MRGRHLPGSFQSQHLDLPASGIIVLFFVAFFGKHIIKREFLIGGDAFFYSHPLRTASWEMIRTGIAPVWLPQTASGFPLLAMAQIGLGYPLTWSYLFLPGYWAEQIFVLAPFLLAPIFTYAYVREIGRSRTAALLAALSYGYGGLMTNTYGMNGIPTNALMWLPLLLIAIERARHGRFIWCLAGGTLVAAFSLLTGHYPSFVQIAVVALLYGLFLTLTQIARLLPEGSPNSCWAPLLLVVFSILLASGLAAFQVFETLRATGLSIRSNLDYAFFSAGGYTPKEALQSFVAPLYHYTEVTTYTAPLFMALAVIAVVVSVRRRRKSDPRIYFWLCIALYAGLFMLGDHSPVYKLLQYVPVLSWFRRPSRYVFEWSFAISILAAYGWDTTSTLARARARRIRNPIATPWSQLLWLALLISSVLLAGFWWYTVTQSPETESRYLWYKLGFTSIVTACISWSLFRAISPYRRLFAAIPLMLVCFVEPFILVGQWWPGTAKSADRFTTPALTTSWLQNVNPEQERVFIRVNGPDEETADQPRFDALNRPVIFGLHNVGGYEPLLLDRYSRALGGVDFDSLNPRLGFAPETDLFAGRSNVLDLLNTGYVVVWPDLDVLESRTITHDGLLFQNQDLGVDLRPKDSFIIRAKQAKGDTLAFVTSLANSVLVEQGSVVAHIQVSTTGGEVISLKLKAGIDTAEWAHERPDVREVVRHKPASVFDRTSEQSRHPAFRYLARLPLSANVTVDQIEITNVSQSASLALWKATIFDSQSGQTSPMSHMLGVDELDSSRWQIEGDFGGVMILRNKRVLPRAWLVTEAEAVGRDEALLRIQGRAETEFNPRRRVLLEVEPNELPNLTGGELGPEDSARITIYEPNRLVVDTIASTPTVLVLSEIFYPGWKATVDGRPVKIDVANYLFRGIALPEGQHRIELRYAPTTVIAGALISLGTFLLIIALLILGAMRPIRHSIGSDEF
ncbi:MAG TPA: YfhO family protein [Pyrinomonadaceae bacterium]|nr:YfhO family protein [Pyrinomonadaceae bacterium]